MLSKHASSLPHSRDALGVGKYFLRVSARRPRPFAYRRTQAVFTTVASCPSRPFGEPRFVSMQAINLDVPRPMMDGSAREKQLRQHGGTSDTRDDSHEPVRRPSGSRCARGRPRADRNPRRPARRCRAESRLSKGRGSVLVRIVRRVASGPRSSVARVAPMADLAQGTKAGR